MLRYRLIFDLTIAALSQMDFDGNRCDESDVAVSFYTCILELTAHVRNRSNSHIFYDITQSHYVTHIFISFKHQWDLIPVTSTQMKPMLLYHSDPTEIPDGKSLRMSRVTPGLTCMNGICRDWRAANESLTNATAFSWNSELRVAGSIENIDCKNTIRWKLDGSSIQ